MHLTIHLTGILNSEVVITLVNELQMIDIIYHCTTKRA